MFTHFSKHALERITQRVVLKPAEIADQVDRKLTVNIGKAPGFNKHHLLIYSEPDQACFVIVQDCLTGEVITLLPLDYHKNLAWGVTEAQCLKAKKIYDDRPEPVGPPLNFHVSVSGNGRSKKLLKISGEPYNNDLQRFLRDKSWLVQLEAAAVHARIQLDDVVVAIKSGNHKGTQPLFIEYHKLPISS